jgi:hypothetical protein
MSFLLALSMMTGCYTTKVYVAPPSTATGRVENEWQQTFFWGLISAGSVNAANICGDAGVVHIKSEIGGLGLLANWVTAGIWAPVRVRVTCGTTPKGTEG